MNSKHAILCVLCAFVILVIVFRQDSSIPQGDVYFFDIGQGDAAFINLPDDVDILIDTGFDNQIVNKLHYYNLVEDNRIEYLIISHPHADHDGGLAYVKDYFEIENVVYYTKPRWGMQLPWVHIDSVVSDNAFPFTYIYPNDFELPDSNPNNASLVLMHEYDGIQILFTGDIEAEAERMLCDSELLDDVDILKVAHHGSASSSSPCFLSQVAAEFGVISAGANNTYGHPHYRALNNLHLSGMQVMRTDQDGDIIFDIKDGAFNIITHKNP